jgi:xanthine dehydrogenase small subunit
MTLLTVNGDTHTVDGNGRTLQDVLHTSLGMKGAKLGCGEGECGSCTVLIDGRAVCSCLQLASHCEGKVIETVEGFAKTDMGQEITEALACHGAVQCGFCTPGFVMSAAGHLRTTGEANDLEAALEGNLCRCTGYSKIRKALSGVTRHPVVLQKRRGRMSRNEAIALLQNQPGIVPIAGGTDFLVKHEGHLPRFDFLDLTAIDDPVISGISVAAKTVSIGALTTWSEIQFHPVIIERLPILQAVAATLGGMQIRNVATIGGNLATASPAGDSLPALRALRATVRVDGPQGERSLPIADFLEGPGKTGLLPGELIVQVDIPAPSGDVKQFFRKVGPRRAQSIAKISLALQARVEEGEIQDIEIAFGAVGPIPMDCPRTRKLILENSLSEDLYPELKRLVLEEIAPIDDFRSTKDYRRNVAPKLLWQALKYVCQH